MIGLSPFDVPERVRGYRDPDSKNFVIEFGYLGDSERRVPRPLDESISIRIGENSGRPYEIHIDVEGLGAENVNLSIVERAIEGYAETLTKGDRQRKVLRVAESILKDKGKELVGST